MQFAVLSEVDHCRLPTVDNHFKSAIFRTAV